MLYKYVKIDMKERKNKTNKNSCECNPNCEKSVCSCKDKECDYLHKQYAMKKWVFWTIIFVISAGALVPFFTEAVCLIWFPDRANVISTWNQFVSIVLGVIATLLSIVSIIMGFKNYEDTLKIQEQYMLSFKELSIIAKDMSNVKRNVDRIYYSQIGSCNVDSAKNPPKKEDWEVDPEGVLNLDENDSNLNE